MTPETRIINTKENGCLLASLHYLCHIKEQSKTNLKTLLTSAEECRYLVSIQLSLMQLSNPRSLQDITDNLTLVLSKKEHQYWALMYASCL